MLANRYVSWHGAIVTTILLSHVMIFASFDRYQLDPVYVDENLEMLERGCINMQHHIRNALKFGVAVVVAVNVFVTDSPREIELVKHKALEAGATAAVESNHWSEGGKGAKNLGRAVVASCKKMRTQGNQFKFLYTLELTIAEKFKII